MVLDHKRSHGKRVQWVLLAAFTLVCVTSAPLPAQSSGLVAAYSFNEGSGTSVTDSSGNGNTGTVANTTWTASGKYGSALVFNGTSALVTINDAASLHLTTAMTLEAWVSASTVNAIYRDVIYKGNDAYYIEGTSTKSAFPSGGGTFGTASGEVFGTAKLTANTWTHLATTYDGANLRMYVNGKLVATLAKTGVIPTSANPLQIGGDSLYGQFFKGNIDEVRVYNVALTLAQIVTDMNTPIAPDTQAPTVPTNLTGTPISGTQINLSWTASTDNVAVSNYLIERCLGPGMQQLRSDRHFGNDHLSRHRGGCQQHLQLPRTSHRRRWQPEYLFQYSHCRNSGRRHAAPHTAHQSDSHSLERQPDQPELDSVH